MTFEGGSIYKTNMQQVQKYQTNGNKDFFF